jgi:hypothetical protein
MLVLAVDGRTARGVRCGNSAHRIWIPTYGSGLAVMLQ